MPSESFNTTSVMPLMTTGVLLSVGSRVHGGNLREDGVLLHIEQEQPVRA